MTTRRSAGPCTLKRGRTAASAPCIRATSCSATASARFPDAPDLPGLKDFRGARCAIRATMAAASTGRASARLVLGTGTSGHDVAQDLAVSGAADVSMIQNGPTLIVSLKEAQSPYALYDEDISFEDCDLLAHGVPLSDLQPLAPAA